MKLWTKIVAGLAAATGVSFLTRRARPGWRVAAGAAAFGLPFVASAVARAVIGPDVVLGVLFDTHGDPDDNAGVAAAARAARVTAWLHAGDVADGPEFYARQWDDVFGGLSPVYAVTGNHDDPERHRARFGELPRVEHAGNVDIFLVGWPGDDGAWLEAAAQQSTARLKILVVHRPPFTSSGLSVVGARLERGLKLMDLVLAGHEHVRWRSTHELGGKRIRQIVGVTGPKLYDCAGRSGCSRTRGFLTIEIWGDEIRTLWTDAGR